MNYPCYQIILWSEAFLDKSREMQCVDDIYHRGAGLAVTWRIRDTGQNSLLFKQKVLAAPFTSKFSPLLHSSRIPLLEIQLYYTMDYKIITHHNNSNNNNNAIITNNHGWPQILILLFQISMGR